MSSKESTSSKGGVGFCSLLAIVFITLKLAGVGIVATWSWWAVLSPLWIPLVILAFILILWAVGYACYSAYK